MIFTGQRIKQNLCIFVRKSHTSHRPSCALHRCVAVVAARAEDAAHQHWRQLWRQVKRQHCSAAALHLASLAVVSAAPLAQRTWACRPV